MAGGGKEDGGGGEGGVAEHAHIPESKENRAEPSQKQAGGDISENGGGEARQHGEGVGCFDRAHAGKHVEGRPVVVRPRFAGVALPDRGVEPLLEGFGVCGRLVGRWRCVALSRLWWREGGFDLCAGGAGDMPEGKPEKMHCITAAGGYRKQANEHRCRIEAYGTKAGAPDRAGCERGGRRFGGLFFAGGASVFFRLWSGVSRRAEGPQGARAIQGAGGNPAERAASVHAAPNSEKHEEAGVFAPVGGGGFLRAEP